MFYLFLGQIACIVLSFIVCLILLGHLSVQRLNLGMISKLLMLVNANLYLNCVFWAVIIKRCCIPKRLLSQRQLCPLLMFRCSELAVWELNGLFIFRFFFLCSNDISWQRHKCFAKCKVRLMTRLFNCSEKAYVAAHLYSCFQKGQWNDP